MSTWREGLNAVDEFNFILVNECPLWREGLTRTIPFALLLTDADDDLYVFYACHLGL
jgi:hypothetical protein